MDFSKVNMNSVVHDAEYEETTIYFDGPVSLLGGKWPDAEEADIAVSFPDSDPEARSALVMRGPVKNGSTLDWEDWDLPNEDIEKLLAIAGY